MEGLGLAESEYVEHRRDGRRVIIFVSQTVDGTRN